MKKIPSLFARNYETDRKVRDEIPPESQWVAEGYGVATRKWDGMAVLIQDGLAFKRYDAKKGRSIPPEFIPAQPAADPNTGHWPGWVPATGPDSKYIQEALQWARIHLFPHSAIPDGTYEACGPAIGTRHGSNPENLSEHILVIHGQDKLLDAPRNFNDLMTYLSDKSIEGIVWHHPDGRMVKIKKNDFPYPDPSLTPKNPRTTF